MISRRGFLKAMAVGCAFVASARFAGASSPDRSLWLHNIHTGEELDTAYCSGGRYDFEEIEKINRLLRCHYTNEVKAIDPGLLDLLADIRTRIAPDSRIEIISGFRSQDYNAHLRSIGRGVARNSYHLRGLAIDFAIPGVRNRDLSSLARDFSAGGVGTYPEFVHIDVGPVRFW